MRKKILLISFILSLPFWWGMNALSVSLEDFLFQKEALTADLSQKVLGDNLGLLKLERERQNRLINLDINARAAISVEVGNNGNEKILFEKNSEDLLAIASLTKLMTALVIFDLDESYDFSQIILISKEAILQDGSSKYVALKIGEKLSVETLLHIMLIESSNDAAFALTELIGKKGFVDLMNLYAKDLELGNTHFVNPTGLDPDEPLELNNISTARDLAKMAKYIADNYPQIFEITRQQQYGAVTNTNEILGEVPGIIGGKTGWTPQAGGCLLLVLENPRGGYFINVILGSKDRFAEMRKIIDVIL